MLAPLIVHLLIASLTILFIGWVMNALFGRPAEEAISRGPRMSGMSLGANRTWSDDRARMRVGRLEFDGRRNFTGHRWN